MGENRRHISLKDGKVTLNKLQVLDARSIHITFTPVVATSRRLGSKGTDTRWLDYDIKVNFEEYKSNKWLMTAVKDYIANGKTPEFEIQGTCTDHDCDFYDAIKVDDTVTCTGCVITSDIPLFDLDTDGEYVSNKIEMNAKTLV